MAARNRSLTGNPEVDRKLDQILDEAGVAHNRDQLLAIMATAVGLGEDGTDRLDLKITSSALAEMRQAFHIFEPYRMTPKITMFGSARTLPDDPLYGQARQLAKTLAGRGWMVVTGAGPGIMAAGLEGAGREMSFGINIRLPFEQGANQFIEGDPKLISMKYFFTRKLMLVKESHGFVVLPGGFGTLDEALELLTLLQTGKADPAPVVLMEVEGGSYWHAFDHFLKSEVESRGLITPGDECLYRITDDVTEASDEILGFYRNYHSRRFVGDRLVIRLQSEPTSDELAELNREFPDIVMAGSIEVTPPLSVELRDDDHVKLPRIIFRFDVQRAARLRMFIDALNALPSAPAELAPPPAPVAPPHQEEREQEEDDEAV
jgi:uncharacterized protein (TIGR00730 family)